MPSVLLALLVGCETTPPPPPNIVIVTLDTTRADHLGAYGYARARTPNIDELAATGIRFTRAWTVSNNTLPAHVSVLSGLQPQRAGVPRNGHKLPSTTPWVPETMRDAGYETAAFVSASALSARLGLDRGFDVYDDRFDVKELDQRQRHGDDTTDAALAWLDKPREKPFFLWVHYFDPHYPYTPPAPYDTLYGAGYQGPADGSLEYLLRVWGRGGKQKIETTAADRQRMIDLYDGEIAWLDVQLGRLFAGIDRDGRGEDTLIVLTADHGESLDEHDYLFDHGEYVYEPSLHIPLIVRPPLRASQPASVVDVAVQNVDVAATALDAAGLSTGALDGRPLLSLIAGAGAAADNRAYAESCRPWQIERRFAGWKNLHKAQTVREGDLKLIATPFQDRLELYDLSSDPGELRNLVAERPGEASRLAALLEEWRGGAVDIAVPDAENMERIRALGYIE
ncbi:MAG: sulfatase [Myxococcota bacterium]|nr:sulfatase [Myxococcota bacterium]